LAFFFAEETPFDCRLPFDDFKARGTSSSDSTVAAFLVVPFFALLSLDLIALASFSAVFSMDAFFLASFAPNGWSSSEESDKAVSL
jgi:hypothetical protein